MLFLPSLEWVMVWGGGRGGGMGTSRVCLCCAQIEAQTSKRKLAGCVAGTKTVRQDDQPSARFASGAQRTSWLAPNTPPRSPSAAMDTKAASSASSCRRPASASERSPVAGSEELALLPAAAHANAVVTIALQADGAMGRKPQPTLRGSSRSHEPPKI